MYFLHPLAWNKRVVALGLGLVVLTFRAQGQSSTLSSASSSAVYVPLPDPGYGLYYHDSATVPNTATRWGYHDGWSDGRHDRNHGDVSTSDKKASYAVPPQHSGHPGMTQDQYEKLYRVAYRHGYEHGSRM